MPSSPALGPPELRRQYETVIEEYRFQVGLNWQRSQYFFVLNLGVLVAGATLLSSTHAPRLLIAAVFLVGDMLAVLSILANRTQTSYYQSTRELKAKLEDELGLGELAISATPGMGSRISRLGRVRTFLTIMLVAIGAVDLLGIAVVAHEHWSPAPHRVTVAIEAAAGNEPGSVTSVVAVSRGGDLVARRSPTGKGGFAPISFEPGRYLFSSSTNPTGCEREITSAPIQTVPESC